MVNWKYDLFLYMMGNLVDLFFREVVPRGSWKVPQSGPVLFVAAPHANQVSLLFLQFLTSTILARANSKPSLRAVTQIKTNQCSCYSVVRRWTGSFTNTSTGGRPPSLAPYCPKVSTWLHWLGIATSWRCPRRSSPRFHESGTGHHLPPRSRQRPYTGSRRWYKFWHWRRTDPGHGLFAAREEHCFGKQ